MPTQPITSVFDPDELIVLPPEGQRFPRMTRSEMRARFAGLLGKSDLPMEEWRAVGDLEALDETVRSTVQWMTKAVVYHTEVPELPAIPHDTVTLPDSKQRVRTPAPGSRAVFDACIAGHRGGLSPSQIESSWQAAKREVITATRGVPGHRRQQLR